MKNKNVGYLIIGISILIIAIILLFNSGLKNIVEEPCDHGSACTMYETISLQTNLSLIIASLVFLIGLFLILSKQPEKIIIKKVKERQKVRKINLQGLDEKEKQAIKILQREKGAYFQKSIMEELEIGKVKMTRMMDKLEAKQLIERKRRGMNNIIVLRR